MIDGDRIIEYGSPAFRAENWLGRFAGTDDGRTILALGSGRVDAIDARTGAVTAGPAGGAATTRGDVVAMATKDRPDAVTLLALPRLTPIAEYDAGGRVHAIALTGDTIAALTDGPSALVLIIDGAIRRIDLPAKATCLDISADGTLVAVGTDRGRGGNVLVVDVVTGTIRHTLTGPRAPVTAVVISAAHDVVAATAGPRVLGWTPSTRKPKAVSLWTAPKEGAELAGITPAGRLIAHGKAGPVVSIDPVTGAVDWEAGSYGPVLVHGDRIVSARFDSCRELDPATGAVTHTWTGGGYTRSLSAAGDTVIGSGRDSRPALFRPGATSVPDLGDGHARGICAIAFDGDRFATLGEDQRVCVWARGRSSPLFTAPIEHRKGVYAHPGLALAGDTLFAADGDRVVRWTLGDPEPQTRSESLDGDVQSVALLPDRGELLAVCSKGYANGVLYRLDAGTLQIRAQAKAPQVRGRIVYTPGATSFGLRRAAGSYDYEIKRLRATGGCDHLADHITPDHTLTVKLHGKGHGTGSSMRVVELATRASLHDKIELPAVTGEPAMSAGGLLAIPHRDAIHLWDVRTATVVRELPLRTPTGWGSALHWTPGDTSILVTRASGGIQEVAVTP